MAFGGEKSAERSCGDENDKRDEDKKSGEGGDGSKDMMVQIEVMKSQNYLQQDVSIDQGLDTHCNSPCLDDLDFVLLDPAYWLANPSQLHCLKHCVFGPCKCSLESESDWVTDLFLPPEELVDSPIPPRPAIIKSPMSTGSVTEPESPIPPRPAIAKSPVSTGSLMEPESPIPPCPAIIKSPASTGSIMEPKSPIPPHPSVMKSPVSTGSITEPESPVPPRPESLSTPKPTHKKWFATPSPPTPDLIYWKYFM
ncbi:hypothetical protein EDB19DRAFT_1834929 [Suillus lakei]|nr:hypothetical protein EDB19DRAFT_1834929 [Suillus lakei]